MLIKNKCDKSLFLNPGVKLQKQKIIKMKSNFIFRNDNSLFHVNAYCSLFKHRAFCW